MTVARRSSGRTGEGVSLSDRARRLRARHTEELLPAAPAWSHAQVVGVGERLWFAALGAPVGVRSHFDTIATWSCEHTSCAERLGPVCGFSAWATPDRALAGWLSPSERTPLTALIPLLTLELTDCLRAGARLRSRHLRVTSCALPALCHCGALAAALTPVPTPLASCYLVRCERCAPLGSISPTHLAQLLGVPVRFAPPHPAAGA